LNTDGVYAKMVASLDRRRNPMHLHDHQDAGHDHRDRRAANKRRLTGALTLAAAYMVAEVIGGYLTGSLALLADAGHMLSDVAALGLSLFAAWLADRPAGSQRTYGYYRTEILAALANAAALVAIAIFIFVEAWQRFRDPPVILGGPMVAIATGGLVVNLLGLWILHAGRQENLNVRGAWLHVLTDAFGSLGAMIAGACVWLFDWPRADPIASVVIAALVIYSAYRLMMESVAVLMESAPRGIDVDEVRGAMGAVPGVRDVHDLHVWTITSGLDSLSAHVVVENGVQHVDVLVLLRKMLHDQFDIGHITIQVEPEDFEERRCPF
jgi:cobalt-zinc-cadmium efflux system protein